MFELTIQITISGKTKVFSSPFVLLLLLLFFLNKSLIREMWKFFCLTWKSVSDDEIDILGRDGIFTKCLEEKRRRKKGFFLKISPIYHFHGTILCLAPAKYSSTLKNYSNLNCPSHYHIILTKDFADTKNKCVTLDAVHNENLNEFFFIALCVLYVVAWHGVK